MKTIHFTAYMLDRLEFRRIPRAVVEKILQTAIERYFDVKTGRLMAVQRVRFAGRYQRVVVAYEEQGTELTAVTVHTVTKRQVQARIRRQRWIPR